MLREFFDTHASITTFDETPDIGYSSNFSMERLSAKIGSISSYQWSVIRGNEVESFPCLK